MTYEQFNQFCKSLPATTYVMQWGDSHVWKVGGKMFAVGGWGPDKQPAYTFKTSDNNFEFLKATDGCRPAPYLASRGMKWIQLYENTELSDDDLIYYLSESHRIVSLGLTKIKQKALGLNQENV